MQSYNFPSELKRKLERKQIKLQDPWEETVITSQTTTQKSIFREVFINLKYLVFESGRGFQVTPAVFKDFNTAEC